jgi:hypothetical protein
MNFGEMIDIVYEKLLDPAKRDHSLVYVKRLLNEAQRTLAHETGFYKKSATIPSVADQQTYDILSQFTSAPDASGTTTAAVITGGNLDASATYYYRFAFYSSYFNFESPASTDTVGGTTDGTKKTLSISSIPTDSNAMITHIRIYRTEGGGAATGPFNYVAAVTNGTTTYDDGLADASLGDDVGALDKESDFISDLAVWYDTDYKLDRMTYPVPEDTDVVGTPTRYFIFNNELGLDVIPNQSSKNILLYYVARPPKLYNDADYPKLPRPYRFMLIYFTLWQIFEEKGVLDKAEYHRGLYERSLYGLSGNTERRDTPTQVKNYLL